MQSVALRPREREARRHRWTVRAWYVLGAALLAVEVLNLLR